MEKGIKPKNFEQFLEGGKKTRFYKGFKHTEATKLKMSASRMGRVSGMFGKKHSEKTKIEMSKNRMNHGHHGWKLSLEIRKRLSEAHRGEKAYNYKGTSPIYKQLRNSLDYEEWRKAVFERDDYTCQKCFAIGEYLHADHIKAFSKFPDLRFEVSNGRTLCVSCHYEVTFNRKLPEGNKWGNKAYRRKNDE